MRPPKRRAPFFAMIRRESPCKVNFLLNVLGRRADGFHELETLFHHVPLMDELTFEHAPNGGLGIQLTCSAPHLLVDNTNLVCRAANSFLAAAQLSDRGLRIHLEKRLPLAAGLGGGSANAAHTLLGLNELFGQPLQSDQLGTLAAGLGSDVNFFLQDRPALATGRGEQVQALEPFSALRGSWMFLYHPGFGISTPWAFAQLRQYSSALQGQPGRALALVDLLRRGDFLAAGRAFYNSLEIPALHKYPVLGFYQKFLRQNGAWAALMSGSGSTTFGLFTDENSARSVVPKFEAEFGSTGWLRVVGL